MKILLVNPRWQKKKGNIWKEVSGVVIPHGLAIIAACLVKDNIDTKVLDVSALRLNTEDIVVFIKNEKFDYFGFTATTFVIEDSLKIAKVCKDTCSGSKIIFGGVHPTIFPEEVLNNEFVDYVVRGEGEESVVELLKNGPGSVKGISYKRNGKIIHNPARPLLENLDSIPLPAYQLFPMSAYHPAVGGYRQVPAISMITSRGCPGRCSFCYKDMFGTKIRMRSAESIVNEIFFLADNYGIREITFYDDTFTASKERTIGFCELLIQKRIHISWSCMSRVDFVNEKILKLMKKSGCHQICYGIESGDEQILRNINKPLLLKKSEEICRLTKSVGIALRTSFMLGNPGETEQSLKKTIDFAIKLKPDIVQFNITTPYPGSEMFNWAKENNYLKTFDWSNYDLSHMIMNLPSVSSDLVEKYYKLAYRKFYLRAGYILRRIVKALSWQEITINVKVFFRILRMLVN